MSDFTAKMHQFDFEWAPDPAGWAYSAPPDPLTDGEGLAAPPEEPHSALGPRYSALRSSVLGPSGLDTLSPDYKDFPSGSRGGIINTGLIQQVVMMWHNWEQWCIYNKLKISQQDEPPRTGLLCQ